MDAVIDSCGGRRTLINGGGAAEARLPHFTGIVPHLERNPAPHSVMLPHIERNHAD
jgi:hypothetical protein